MAKRTPTTQRSGAKGTIVRAALAHGRERAAAAIGARTRMRARGPSNGLLIAEGDSWFDYPFFDALERLEQRFGFRIESVAHKGDTVEQMAYDPNQYGKLLKLFERVAAQGDVPRAILLSGGGNDIAGEELGFLLNHAGSGLAPLNARIVEGVLTERLQFAIVSVISFMTHLSQQHFGRKVPVVVHGYGHAVPDGRGYLGGFWVLPGPWLKPAFAEKGYSDLQQTAGVVRDLIDRFNALLQSLPSHFGLAHVTYVDVRDVLSSDLANKRYTRSWNDELHPTQPGFEAVAGKLSAAILQFPNPAPRTSPRAAARPPAGRAASRPAGPK